MKMAVSWGDAPAGLLDHESLGADEPDAKRVRVPAIGRSGVAN
jgi:hypothetical protein